MANETVATATVTDSSSGRSVVVNVPAFDTIADVVARCDSEAAAVSLASQQWRVAMAPGARRTIAAAVKADENVSDEALADIVQKYVDGYIYGVRTATGGSAVAKADKLVADRSAKLKATGVKFSEAQLQALRDNGLLID